MTRGLKEPAAMREMHEIRKRHADQKPNATAKAKTLGGQS
jgi:hypothetical protein